MFEILKSDLRGRIGILETNHGKIETPAFVPVIHPVRQAIPPKLIKEMGFDMIITNAHITRRNYDKKAIERGIHDLVNFDGVVMTDSGGYQVLEYGDVDTTPQEMAKFEIDINTDIAIPLDKPTGYGLAKDIASKYVKYTLEISQQTLNDSRDNGQIWVGPIQGGEHTELVIESTKKLVDMNFKMLALGSPVEFMESYRYKLLSEMIISAKRHIPHSIPLHLFGAGHPLTVGFSVALGCDTFDSASYMLYAKQNRYITEDGTRDLNDIVTFPCTCKICTKYTPQELQDMDKETRIYNIAIHNLYIIKNEVDKVKQAIHEGRLWEYVIKKARAHPRLFEIIKVFTDNSDFFMESTPRFKEKAIFLYDEIDQFRPEILHYHNIVKNFKTEKEKLIITKESATKPAYLSYDYHNLSKKNIKEYQICQYSPHLGIIPLEISDIFPAAHHETAKIHPNPANYPMFEKVWVSFFTNNKFSEIKYDTDDKFLEYYINKIKK